MEQRKILVFKTDIESTTAYLILKRVLDSYYGIIAWSLDQDDCDNVLRIVGSTKLNGHSITTYILRAGFHCELLSQMENA